MQYLSISIGQEVNQSEQFFVVKVCIGRGNGIHHQRILLTDREYGQQVHPVPLFHMLQCHVPNYGGQPFAEPVIVPQVPQRHECQDKSIVHEVVDHGAVLLDNVHAYPRHLGTVRSV